MSNSVMESTILSRLLLTPSSFGLLECTISSSHRLNSSYIKPCKIMTFLHSMHTHIHNTRKVMLPISHERSTSSLIIDPSPQLQSSHTPSSSQSACIHLQTDLGVPNLVVQCRSMQMNACTNIIIEVQAH